MPIDLRSDTVTKPVPGMMDAMMSAPLGDDVFEEDPTVIALEEKTAALFGKEAGIFCPSGTMTNQIAIKLHTQPGDEVICDRMAHIYNYEGGGMAFNSGVSVRLVHGDRGRILPAHILENINPDNVHFPRTTLVSIENTSNRGGGCCYDPAQVKAIAQTCREHQLPLHLDGARIFNALAVTGESPNEMGTSMDTISVCLSKGLGAPVGSVLLGTRDHVYKARRIRKVFGGGMRQAGLLAAAGIYALDHHIDRLSQDHARAATLGHALDQLDYVAEVLPVETNIVVYRLQDEIGQETHLEALEANGIKAVPFGPQTIRLVTHLDIDDTQVEQTIHVLKALH